MLFIFFRGSWKYERNAMSHVQSKWRHVPRDILRSYFHQPLSQKSEIYFLNILTQILDVIQPDVALYSHVH